MKKICENTADWSGKTKHTRDRQRETVREKVVVSGAPRMQSHEGRPRRSTFSSTVLPTKLLEIAFCTNKVFWFCSSSLDSDIWHGGGLGVQWATCMHTWMTSMLKLNKKARREGESWFSRECTRMTAPPCHPRRQSLSVFKLLLNRLCWFICHYVRWRHDKDLSLILLDNKYTGLSMFIVYYENLQNKQFLKHINCNPI